MTETIRYSDGETSFAGTMVLPEGADGKRPCILVAHTWAGEGDHERRVASRLAQAGYVGFAIDLFGEGVRGSSPETNQQLIKPLLEDRALLKRRLLAAVDAAAEHGAVDPDRIAAIGYCFGGLCALDLARSADPRIKAAASFHGLFTPPNLGQQPKITASVLILHGYSDPMAKPDTMVAVADELTAAGADWQLHAYGHALHGFAVPGANAPDRGIAHDEKADHRSWRTLMDFLHESLGH